MIEKRRLAEIVEKNPKVDRTAIKRGEQAVKQLADVNGARWNPARTCPS